jgi:hypothetical protein
MNKELPEHRYHDSTGGGFIHLADYNRLMHMIVEGGVKPYQGKAGFSSLIKLTSEMTDDFNPFAVIWRAESLPIVLSMAPTNTADNVFHVGVNTVSPSQGHDAIKEIVGEELYTSAYAHNHYLLNEIALRTALALCYESVEYDNEGVRMLCCVGDELTYPTDIDIDSFPSKDERIEILGVMYSEMSVEGEAKDRSEEELRYDAMFFPQEFSQLDEFFEDNFTETKPTITKVEAYLDTRAPLTWGKSDWWVEMIRCSVCNQRVILGLTKAQCPDGQPDVRFECKACKTTIKHL